MYFTKEEKKTHRKHKVYFLTLINISWGKLFLSKMYLYICCNHTKQGQDTSAVLISTT